MIWLDIAIIGGRLLALLLLYLVIATGPGFVLGILLANWLFARGQPTYMETHQENIRRAAQHNAQWHPTNERWQK